MKSIANKFKLIIINFFVLRKLKNYGRNVNIHFDSIIDGHKNISIGNNFKTGRNLRLEAIEKYYNFTYKPQIKIGNNVSFNNNVHIGAISKIQIGDNCLFGSNILITDHSHGNLNLPVNGIFKTQNLYSKGDVKIEENVWIGENSCILPGVKIGKNTVIACNSTVTKNLNSNSVYAGNPAKFVKKIL